MWVYSRGGTSRSVHIMKNFVFLCPYKLEIVLTSRISTEKLEEVIPIKLNEWKAKLKVYLSQKPASNIILYDE